VPNGVYAFTVTPPDGYEASPSSGSITVHFADINQQVTFASTISDGLPLFALVIALGIVLTVVLLAIVFYQRKTLGRANPPEKRDMSVLNFDLGLVNDK